ncbi:MAG: hypothetical protein ACE5IP_10640 [Terriglobia bacterium]
MESGRHFAPKGFWSLPGLLALIFLLALATERPARAGGPFIVGGTLGPDGQPFTWSTATEIQYRTDGGTLGTLSNPVANSRVQAMFQVWEDVPTASIGYMRAGALSGAGLVGGDIDTMEEFNLFECGSANESQNPIIYDTDGSLFLDLGFPSGVIGFAGPCQVNPLGRIVSGRAALNGKFIDGDSTNGELSSSAFDGAFIHEFGHFSGLDHSQVNLNCLSGGCASGSDDAFGLPTMFPFLFGSLEDVSGQAAVSTLAMDDIAWISKLYPETLNNPPTQVPFSTSFGTISGTIFFSDGVTHVQGANVIARQVDNMGTPEDESRRNAVSVVSGYLFTGNPGQSVTGTNTAGSSFGSRDPTLIGTYDIPVLPVPENYTVEVESINPAFVDGSSTGPLLEQVPLPGPAEFHSGPSESNSDDPMDPALSIAVPVIAGMDTAGIDIILNGTGPRFDSFESARLWLPESLPIWVRAEFPQCSRVAA